MLKIIVAIAAILLPIGFGSIVSGQGGEPVEIRTLAWSPDGTKIAVGAGPNVCELEGADYSVRIVDALTSQVIDRLVSHSCVVNSVQWSADGTRLLVSSLDGVADIWDVAGGRPIVTSPSYTQPGRIMDVWSPDESKVANLSYGTPNIFLWDALTGQTLAEFSSGGSLSIDWSPDGSKLAFGGAQPRVLDATSGQTLMPLVGYSGVAVAAIAWSPDGTKIAGGGAGEDSSIRIWDAATGIPLQILQGHTSIVNRIVWSPDSNEVVSASSDGTIRVWDVSTGYQLDSFTNLGPAYAVDWSPDGSQIAFGGAGSGENIVIASPSLAVPSPTPTATPTSTPIPPGFGKIAYSSIVDVQLGQDVYQLAQIHVANADGSNPVNISNVGLDPIWRRVNKRHLQDKWSAS